MPLLGCVPLQNNTLFHLDPQDPRLRKVAAESAAECCRLCADCLTWSFTHHWGPSVPPCHLSWVAPLQVDNHSSGSWGGTTSVPSHLDGIYTIDTSVAGRRQIFEGIMVELQSDSIGSDNEGMPDAAIGVPHDLIPEERVRFATEVLRGTRYIRLALGLYLRGVSADGQNIVGRWPEQMEELRQLHQLSGVQGWAPEYWSPPPHWKSSGSYYNGTLASFDDSFLDSFSNATLQDVKYLTAHGLPVSWWGLQNEPNFQTENITSCPKQDDDAAAETGSHLPAGISMGAGMRVGSNTYSRCNYDQCDYYRAFVACATKIRAYDLTIRIHANSATGQLGASPIANNPETLPLLDAFTWHTVNAPSSHTFGNRSTHYNYGKVDFTNEMEYQPGSPFAGTAVGTVALLNTFLNTLTFKDSPTGVISLHASKPTTNIEALGYGWTWWWPTNGSAPPALPGLRPNHFAYNYWNWAAVAPFIKTVPWNSVRLGVDEAPVARMRQRVVAFETPEVGRGGPLHANTPAGKLIVVLTNEDGAANFTAKVRSVDGRVRTWEGFQYQGSMDGAEFNVSLGSRIGAIFSTTLSPATMQWWYEREGTEASRSK